MPSKRTKSPAHILGRKAALSFDPATFDYVDVSTALTAVASLQSGAISVWLKTIADGQILSAGYTVSNGFYLILAITSGKVAIQHNNDAAFDRVEGSTIVTDGTLHHILIQSTGTEYEVFVDNIRETLTATSGTNDGNWYGDTTNLDTLNIGVLERTTLAGYYTGVQSNVRIYNRALTETEIDDLYNRHQAPSTGLVGFWPLDDGSGTTAADQSGNGYDGTLNGSPTWLTEGAPAWSLENKCQFLFHPQLTGDVAAGGSFVEESVNRGTVPLNGNATIDRNQGLVLDGTGDYVECLPRITSLPFSVVLAFKYTNAGYGAFVWQAKTVGADGVWIRGEPSDNRIRCALISSVADVVLLVTTAPYNDGTPHFLMFQGRDGEQRLYLDGSLGDSASIAIPSFSNSDNFEIGRKNSSNAIENYLNGTLPAIVTVDQYLSFAQYLAVCQNIAPPGVDARSILGL